MNDEVKFVLLVIRNALVLAGLFFFTTWIGDVAFMPLLKIVAGFLGTYIFTELAKHYGLDKSVLKTTPNKTMIFT